MVSRVDRCALFVDAGYALADGAMAVHGTRRRDSVSWDHAGLLKLLAGLARDRTGLPVLRCYWYEIAEGQRTTEHDELAEMPGLKLRLVNIRPGRREGIESQLRRDLVALARSGAIADAFIASADEHVAEIVSEVQDLGLRVVILNITSDAGWTIPQPLRQECDDIVEISGVHLRPFVELVRGAEPAPPEEQHVSAGFGARGLTDDDGSLVGAMTGQGLHAAQPAATGTYQAPVGSDYGATAQPYASAAQPRPYAAGADAYAAPPSAHVGSHAESAGSTLPRSVQTGALGAQASDAAPAGSFGSAGGSGQPSGSGQPESSWQFGSSGQHGGHAPGAAQQGGHAPGTEQHPAHAGGVPQHAAHSTGPLQHGSHSQGTHQVADPRGGVPQHPSNAGGSPQHAAPAGQYAPGPAAGTEAQMASMQGGHDNLSTSISPVTTGVPASYQDGAGPSGARGAATNAAPSENNDGMQGH